MSGTRQHLSKRRTPASAAERLFVCAFALLPFMVPSAPVRAADTDPTPAAVEAPTEQPKRKPPVPKVAATPAPAVPAAPNLTGTATPRNPGRPAPMPAPLSVSPVPSFDDLPVPPAPPTIESVLAVPAEETEPVPNDVPTPPAPLAEPPQIAAVPSLAPGAEKPAPPPAPRAKPAPANLPAGQDFRVVFEGGSNRLAPKDAAVLDGIAARLAANETARLQIRAYAGTPGEEARVARRASLDRALAVRSFLIDQGVRSTRMDVRALGQNSGDGPPDRVDLELMNE
jgi:outer membrane protein OmpA-like peptidoglycan-associated protein